METNQAIDNEEDPYRWLEQTKDERVLGWVREKNQATTAALETAPEFALIRDRTLEVLDSQEQIASPTLMGEYVYNFWQDAEHPRGLWRRIPVADFQQGRTDWEPVLDVDALARAENKDWIWWGIECLPPEYRHCMVRLVQGDKGRKVQREFDTRIKTFVAGGFEVWKNEPNVKWKDANTLWVAPDLGEGSLTKRGGSRVARAWKRGTPLEQAEVVLEGESGDYFVKGKSYHTPDGCYDAPYRRPSLYSTQHFLLRDGRLILLELPVDVGVFTFFKKHLVFSLDSDWTIAGKTYKQGSLLAIDINRFVEGARDFSVLDQPGEHGPLVQHGTATTRNLLLVSTLDNLAGRLHEYRYEQGTWTRTEAPVPRLGSVRVVTAESWDSDDYYIDSDDYYITYSDFLHPTSLQLVRDGKPQTVHSMPSFFSSEGLEASQHEAVSADGTRIPYFLVGRRDMPLDGSNPTLIYGYGGYNLSLLPKYEARVGAAWLEKGGVYVVANIRGGGEFGTRWWKAAVRENRHRSFEDFIAVAEDLIARGITCPRHLGIWGVSNGGLLVGAVLTMRPELFNAVVCGFPILDLKWGTKDGSASSNTAFDEIGDPGDPKIWEYLRTYSPYHNVAQGRTYPRVLFLTGTRDGSAHPGHARKMAARMLEYGHPIYFYEHPEAGHGGVNHEQTAYLDALMYTYLWAQLR